MLLIRHGHCNGELSNDPPLSSFGKEQAALLPATFSFEYKNILCSPKRRAKETALLLKQGATVKKIEIINELREINPNALDEFAVFSEVRHERAFQAVFNTIQPRLEQDQIIVVSHRNLLNLVISALTGRSFFDWFCHPATAVEIRMINGAPCIFQAYSILADSSARYRRNGGTCV